MIDPSGQTDVAAPRIAASFRGEMGRLSRGVLIYGVTGALSRIGTLLLVPVLTAYLTPAEHGVLSLLTTLTAMLVPLLSVGLGAAAGACYFQGNSVDRKSATIWTSLLMIMPGILLLGVAAVVFPALLSALLFDNPRVTGLVSVTLVSTACALASLPFTMYLQFEERAGSYARVMLASSAVSLIGTVLGVVWLRLGMTGVVYASLMGQATLLAVLIVTVAVRVPRRFSGAVLRDLIRLGLALVPAVGCVFVLQHGNKFLLERISGLDALGIYTVGFNLGLALSVLVGAFQTAWLPFAMSFTERRDEATIVFGRILTYYVIGGGLVTILFFAGARPVVLLLADPKFHEAYRVVGLSAATQFFSGAFAVLLPAVYFARQVQYITLMQGLAAIAAMVMNVMLIPRFGVIGAGLALAAGSLVLVVLQHAWNVTRKSTYLQAKYEWYRIASALTLYAIIGALTLWPRSIRIGPELLFAGVAAGCGVLTAYFALTAQERAALRSLARNVRPTFCAEAA